jgi:hypothetical protein
MAAGIRQGLALSVGQHKSVIGDIYDYLQEGCFLSHFLGQIPSHRMLQQRQVSTTKPEPTVDSLRTRFSKQIIVPDSQIGGNLADNHFALFLLCCFYTSLMTTADCTHRKTYFVPEFLNRGRTDQPLSLPIVVGHTIVFGGPLRGSPFRSMPSCSFSSTIH